MKWKVRLVKKYIEINPLKSPLLEVIINNLNKTFDSAYNIVINYERSQRVLLLN